MFLFVYPYMQYPHHLGDNLYANVNFHIRFFVFVILVSSVVTPPLVTLEAIHWARDGPKFVCRIDGCDASYWPNTTWYDIFGHATIWLWSWTSPNTHLLGRKAQGIKIMWPCMRRSWITFWHGIVAMSRRQLLRLGGIQT
jgi:hypothetical protein